MNTKNLNLLYIFKSIAEEKSLSKAAEKLGLSQPTMSYSIKRLRQDFNDELFIRLSHGVSLTPKASAVLPGILEFLSNLESVYTDKDLPLSQFQGQFVLAATSYFESQIIKSLSQALQTQAPLAKFKTVSLLGQTPVSELENGTVDLAVAAYFENLPERFFSRTIAKDHYVLVLKKNHPYLKSKRSLEDYLKLSHIRIALGQNDVGRIDRVLATKNKHRHIVAQLGDFMSALILCSEGDFALTIPQRLGHLYKSIRNLEVLELPIKLDPIEIKMIWHARTQKNSTQKWFRETVVNSFRLP